MNVLLKQIVFLTRPFGHRKLLVVFVVSVVQGLFQVAGVTSVFPFLALASDPDRVRESEIGATVLSWLPPMSNQELMILAGTVSVVMLLIASVVNLAAELVRNNYSYRFAQWLSVQLLSQIAGQPYGYFLTTNSGVLLKKVTVDVNSVMASIVQQMVDIMSKVCVALCLMVTLLLVDPVISLGAGILLGGYYLTVFLLMDPHRRRISAAMKKALRGINREAQQLLEGIKPIRVHNAEAFFVERFKVHTITSYRYGRWIPILGWAPRYFLEPIAFSGLILVVVYYASRGQDLAHLIPNLGVLALAGYRLLPYLQQIYSQSTRLTSQRHALEEVVDEFKQDGGFAAIKPLRHGRVEPLQWSREIRLEDVCFSYPGVKRATLRDISLTISKNTSVAFVGPTGSGKSTLADLIIGLHRPQTGRVLIDGTELTDESMHQWRAAVGYVPQDVFLTDDTLAHNVALGVADQEIDGDRLREVCAIAQILNFIEQETSNGFDTYVGERGVRLSGGQRQRIGLARALYHRPSVLLLDEATSALDVDTESMLVDALTSLHGNLTMLVIAHRLSTVERCEKRFALREGTVKDDAMHSKQR